MDKFDGVSRAEIISVTYFDEATTQTAFKTAFDPYSPSKQSESKKGRNLAKNNGKRLSLCVRCIFCALVLAVCLAGKFTASESFKAASGFIKGELSKDYISGQANE